MQMIAVAMSVTSHSEQELQERRLWESLEDGREVETRNIARKRNVVRFIGAS
jgi:hypothetical protein